MKTIGTRILILLVICCSSVFCKKDHSNQIVDGPLPKDEDPVIDNGGQFQKNLVVDALMYEKLVADYKDKGVGTQFITNNISNPATAALGVTPQPVALLQTTTIDNSAIVNAEGDRVFTLALQWLITKDKSEAEPYLQKTKTYLLAWAAVNKATDFMPGEVAYSKFIYAYSIIRYKLTDADKKTIDKWLKDRYTTVYKSFVPRANNWETCRLNLIFDIAYVTGDVDMLAFAKQSYRTLINVNIFKNGSSEDLGGRDAYAYHGYNLSFYAKILRSIYLFEGAEKGVEWRNVKNNIGQNVHDMVMNMKPFMDNPTKNVHIEFVNTEYAPDKLRSDYNKAFAPASAMYVWNELVFSFPVEIMETIRIYQANATPFNRTLPFYLSSLSLSRPL